MQDVVIYVVGACIMLFVGFVCRSVGRFKNTWKQVCEMSFSHESIVNGKDSKERNRLIQEHSVKLDKMEGYLEHMRKEGAKRKEENTLIIKSLYAIMDGMKQLNCNGPVSEAHGELQDHILEERR